MFTKSLCSAVAVALIAMAPLGASATSKSSMSSMKTTHQCRDAKGHFVKGKYAKCPAGTHKAM